MIKKSQGRAIDKSDRWYLKTNQMNTVAGIIGYVKWIIIQIKKLKEKMGTSAFL